MTLRNSGCSLSPAACDKHVRTGVIENRVLHSTVGGIVLNK